MNFSLLKKKQFDIKITIETVLENFLNVINLPYNQTPISSQIHSDIKYYQNKKKSCLYTLDMIKHFDNFIFLLSCTSFFKNNIFYFLDFSNKEYEILSMNDFYKNFYQLKYPVYLKFNIQNLYKNSNIYKNIHYKYGKNNENNPTILFIKFMYENNEYTIPIEKLEEQEI